MWKALKYILIYFAFQLLGAVVVLIPGYIMDADEAVILVIALAVANLLFCLYIFRKNRIRLDKQSFTIRPWTILLLSVIAVFFFILPEVELIERLDLPNNLGDELDDVGGTFLGLISIGILGPISEELLFRGAVLGSLLEWRPIRSMPWIAILLSAALFGLVHMNPAQMPGAFAIGLLYGWLAYRTGSLLPGIVGHIFNNSLVCILEMFPEEEGSPETVAEMFDSPLLEFLAVAASLIVCIVVVKTIARIVNEHYPHPAFSMVSDDMAHPGQEFIEE